MTLDPIILIVIAGVVILVVLKIFFGFAKLFFKIGALILIAIVIWRLFMMNS